jgi:protein-disulfide isomerase
MSTKSVTILAVALLLAGAAAFYFKSGPVATPDVQSASIEPAADDAPAQAADHVTAVVAKDETSAKAMTVDEIKNVMKERSVGKKDAPVTLTEFASLSCPHCAHFYKETFPKLKTEYIDTGKVRYTYIDFPLNGPALNAAAVALCVPEDKYFNYVEYLFKTQEQWAFAPDPKKTLIQNAKLLGADGDKLDQCYQSNELKAALAERMKTEGEKYGVESTPSFVINNDKTQAFSGALDYDQFKLKLDAALAVKGVK